MCLRQGTTQKRKVCHGALKRIYTPEKYEAMEHLSPGLHPAERIIKSACAESRTVHFGGGTFIPGLSADRTAEKHQLCEYNYAIKQIHFPDDMETLIEARKRFVFDELFLFILNLQYQKRKEGKEKISFLSSRMILWSN